jgi:hypothetical protein
MKSLFDPKFRYVPSVATDIRKTFARVRREQEKARCHAQESSCQQSDGNSGSRLTLLRKSS